MDVSPVSLWHAGEHQASIMSQAAQAATQLAVCMQVVFLNQQGMLEAGIDQGGLLKEFLEEASRCALCCL